MKQKIFTSITLSKKLKNKVDLCVKTLGIDKTDLLSVLCYKAGKFVCPETRSFKTVEYQDRGGDYEIVPVFFFASDHEYMHGCRLSCKVSVSKLLACAMVMFLDEIMEKGINQMEIAQLRIIQNSYNKKTYTMRNFIVKLNKNDQFQDYIMKMRIKKKKKT